MNIQHLYDAIISAIDLNQIVCDECDQCGFSVHAYYTRMFTDHGEEPVELLILRVICNSCGKTHAILPSFIVPYRRHSLMDHVLTVTAARHSGLRDLFDRQIVASREEYNAIRRLFRRYWKQRLLGEQIGFDDQLTENCINSFRRQFMQIHCTSCLLYTGNHISPTLVPS